MVREVTQSERYSTYAPVGMIRASWDGVNWVRGSFSIVGINDVLTATHVIYDPDLGGWARHIELHPAVDYNGVTGSYEDRPITLGSYQYRAWGFPNQVFADSNNNTLQASESQYDVALLGLSIPLGRDTGWFGLNAGYDGGVQANALGYPGGYTGMMLGSLYALASTTTGTYSSASSDAVAMGAGSSGGPLLVGDEVIGVKSAASATTAVFADIGLIATQLREQLDDNNDLLGLTFIPTANADWLSGTSNGETIDGLSGNDVLVGNGGNDILIGNAGNDELNGGSGRDIARFALNRAGYTVSRDPDTGQILVQASSGQEGSDLLIDMERLQFANGTLAFDGDGSAGQAYRLYKAAFDRSPDNGGLSFWIDALDRGVGDLIWAANFFANSPEFVSSYGATSNSAFVNLLYQNVLDRPGEAAGIAFWVGELDSGARSRAKVLADFSESAENRANVIGVIETGIWFS